MAGTYNLTKTIDDGTSDKLIYNLHFDWDGDGAFSANGEITNTDNSGGVVIMSSNTATLDFTGFVDNKNLVVDISDLNNIDLYPDISSVRLTKAKGNSTNWQKGVNSFFLVDSEGNKYFTFGYDSFKNSFYPQGYNFSDQNTDATGDLYFGAILEPASGAGTNTESQSLDVELCFRKNYGES